MIICFLSFHFNEMSPIENLDFNHIQVQKFFEGFNKNEENRIFDFEKYFKIDNILLLNNDSLKSENCKELLDKFFYNIDYPLYRNTLLPYQDCSPVFFLAPHSPKKLLNQML